MEYFEGLKIRGLSFLWVEHTRAKGNVEGGGGMKMHIQPGVEIIYVTDGKIDITTDGNTETAHTGEAAMIFPFQPHGYKKYEGSEFIRFDLDSSLAFDFFNTNRNCVGTRTVFKASKVTETIVKENFVNKAASSQFTVQSFLYSSLADFTRQVDMISKKESDNILVKTIDYIRSNKEKPLKMCTVAKALGYSESYFSYAINKTSGLGFNSLLAMIRTENAKTLLRESNKTILEIIFECGFGSERSFYRQFSSTVGQSPLQYRKSVLQDK